MEALEKVLHLSINPDIKKRMLRVYGADGVVYILDGMVSTDFLQRDVLGRFLPHAEEHYQGTLEQALMTLLPIEDVVKATDVEEAAQQIMTGKAVLLAEGMGCALCIDIRMFVRRGVSTPLTESVVIGPHQGFNESIRDNLTLLRRMLPTPDLIGEMTEVGDQIPTSLCILYIDGVVEEECLKSVKNRLNSLHTDHVLSIGALEQLLEDTPYSLLPQCCLTERPDRAASC